MNIFADTNIFLANALDEPEKPRIVGLTFVSHIVAPILLLYEIGDALTALVKRYCLPPEEAKTAFESTRKIPFKFTHSDIQESSALSSPLINAQRKLQALTCCLEVNHEGLYSGLLDQ